MILRFADVVKLAYTKLRTRRLRLFISLFIASLLFGALMLGTIVVSGALTSIDSFSKDGFSSRYIVAGIDRNFDSELAYNEALIARATQLQKDEIAAKKAAAKRLGVIYEETFEQAIGETVVTDPSTGQKTLNITSPLAQKAIAELQANDPNLPSFDKFKKQVDQADNYYVGINRSGMREYQPTMVLIQDGKEMVDASKNGASLGYGYSDAGLSSGLSSMTSEWNLLDENLLKPFLLPGQNLEIGKDGSLPIVASYSASQEVLKLAKLPRNATAEERKQRLEEVRKKIAGQTFEICYRNYTSGKLYQEAVQQQQLIEINKGKKDFVKPSLIRKLSTTPCSDPIIDKDTRSAEEKRYDTQKEKFDREFGEPASSNEVLKFRIVGVTQDSPYGSDMSGSGSFGAMDIIYSITASSLGAKWVSPLSVKNFSPSVEDVFADNSAYVFGSQRAYFAEYSNAEVARKALKEKDCRVDMGGFATGQDTSLPVCSVRGERTFSLMPYGSASLAIDDFRQAFRHFQMWATLIIGGVAAVILMGVIGRIIADARKETAVFRATGASRLMIAQIYVMYTMFLVAIMVVISMIIGVGIALIINHQYSPDASVNMALLFNVDDLSKQFTFYGLDLYDIGLISASILVAAIIASSVPIAGNVQRNPINDMRNE